MIMYDLTKFYDTVTVPSLVRGALDRRYPPAVLAMSLATYLSSRVIRAAECFSEWVHPANSVLPGCGEANLGARCCIFLVAEEASNVSPLVELGQLVDA